MVSHAHTLPASAMNFKEYKGERAGLTDLGIQGWKTLTLASEFDPRPRV